MPHAGRRDPSRRTATLLFRVAHSEVSLGCIVGEANPAIAKEAGERVPAAQHIIDHLGEIMVTQELGEPPAEPDVEIVHESSWRLFLRAAPSTSAGSKNLRRPWAKQAASSTGAGWRPAA